MTKVKFLSAAYFPMIPKLSATLPEVPGAHLRIQYRIEDVPERGTVHYGLLIENGRIVEAREGTIDDPSFTVTMGYPVSVRIHRAEVKPPQAVAAGEVTVVGDKSKLQTMMSVVGRPEYEAMVKELTEHVEF